jgi:hypothetical protein
MSHAKGGGSARSLYGGRGGGSIGYLYVARGREATPKEEAGWRHSVSGSVGGEGDISVEVHPP